MTELNHLFLPLKAGNLQLKNRIILLPLSIGAAAGGKPSRIMNTFLAERARGGAGAICASLNPLPGGFQMVDALVNDIGDDTYIPALRELTSLIHDNGAPIVAQLVSLEFWKRDASSPIEVVGPSEVAVRAKGHKPRALTIEDIHLFARHYGEAARRTREAGYDAVEVMGGIGGSISRFMSPLANQRTDEYGGSLENRMRFPLEIIQEIKARAGDDFTILWRYSGNEFIEGGYDTEEACRIGGVLEKAGVSWLNIQVGWHDSPSPLVTKEVPQGGWVYIAEQIKKSVSIPVVASYRITDPVMADRIIAEGKADLIGMARALIADPEWPNKAREGRLDEINRCICCCRCLDQGLSQHQQLQICNVNARVGDDILTNITPAGKKKKVLVVGGGPAGMEAARVAALRGHTVTLWEKADHLGGLLEYAKIPPSKDEIIYLIDYLKNQMKKQGVTVVLNKEATPESIIEQKADAVILATGSEVLVPPIPGIDRPNVVTSLEILSGEKSVGNNVIVIGGGTIGCEISLMLVGQGKKVTIVEMLRKVGMDIGPTERFITITLLKQNGVGLQPETKAIEIVEDGVKAVTNGETRLFQADTIILAAGMKPCNKLASHLAGKVAGLYTIGDCVEPKRIGEAIKSAYRTALNI
ncbi:MAG: FAD-dependent oxidoreductase [Chloroflexi bacterium]|nr:FAD-dependent oxidoreductase [Chloroflexota bacterium]